SPRERGKRPDTRAMASARARIARSMRQGAERLAVPRVEPGGVDGRAQAFDGSARGSFHAALDGELEVEFVGSPTVSASGAGVGGFFCDQGALFDQRGVRVNLVSTTEQADDARRVEALDHGQERAEDAIGRLAPEAARDVELARFALAGDARERLAEL